MTPKEKAKELVLKFAFKGAQHEGEAKSFALIAVDEIIKLLVYLSDGEWTYIYEVEYYKKVKQEIKKL